MLMNWHVMALLRDQTRNRYSWPQLRFHSLTASSFSVCCKDNVRHYLTSISVASAHREHILGQLFGCNSVSASSDECTMDDTTAEVMQYVRQHNIDAMSYLQDRVLPKISQNNKHKWNE